MALSSFSWTTAKGFVFLGLPVTCLPLQVYFPFSPKFILSANKSDHEHFCTSKTAWLQCLLIWLYLPSQGILGPWQTHAVVGWPSFSTFSTEAIIFYSPRLGIAFPSSGTLSLPFIASKTLILAQNTASRKKKEKSLLFITFPETFGSSDSLFLSPPHSIHGFLMTFMELFITFRYLSYYSIQNLFRPSE